MRISGAEAEARIEQLVAHLPGVDVAILYGSRARGNATDDSDVDVLLIADDSSSTIDLRRWLTEGRSLIGSPMSISIWRQRDLCREQSVRPAFVAHLRDEGRLVHRKSESAARLTLEILSMAATRSALEREADGRATAALSSLSYRRLNRSYVSALARVYSAAKGVSMARLASIGEPDYDWRHTFDTFSEVWPSARDAAITLKSLRPFYEHVRGTAFLTLCSRPENFEIVRRSGAALQEVTVVGRA